MRHALTTAAMVCTVYIALALRALPAAGAPSDELVSARQKFRSGDFAAALPILNFLMYPTVRLARVDDIIEAHILLGACGVETGDRVIATREYEQAMYLSTSVTLDPLLFSNDAIAHFDQTKAALVARNLRDAETRALAEERDRLRKYRESLIVYEVRSYYVNFVPFGAGQFQNRQIGKGIFFAGTQLATGGTSVGIWLYLVGKYGYGGRVPPESAAFARRLQQVEIATGAACLGFMFWGVVDSLVKYQPRVQVSDDPSLPSVPPASRSQGSVTERGANKRTLASAIQWGPMIVDGGGGLSLTGVF
jgi:hypothetical protein